MRRLSTAWKFACEPMATVMVFACGSISSGTTRITFAASDVKARRVSWGITSPASCLKRKPLCPAKATAISCAVTNPISNITSPIFFFAFAGLFVRTSKAECTCSLVTFPSLVKIRPSFRFFNCEGSISSSISGIFIST